MSFSKAFFPVPPFGLEETRGKDRARSKLLLGVSRVKLGVTSYDVVA